MADTTKNAKVRTAKPVYKNFITKIQRTIDESEGSKITGRSKFAAETLNQIAVYIIDRLMETMNVLTPDEDKAGTLSIAVVEASLMVFKGQLYSEARSHGRDAVARFEKTKEKNGPEKQTQASRAGIILSPPRVRKQLIRMFNSRHIAKTAVVYLAAVTEYVLSQILLLSKDVLLKVNPKKVRIFPRHIQLAIESDLELANFFKCNIIAGGISPITFEGIRSKGAKKVSGAPEEVSEGEEEEGEVSEGDEEDEEEDE